MFSRPAGAHSVELILNKTNIAERHVYGPFHLVYLRYGSEIYPSTFKISWVPTHHQFVIKNEPCFGGYNSPSFVSLLRASDAVLAVEVTTFARVGEHVPQSASLLSWMVSFDCGVDQILCQREWKLDASNLPKVLESSPGQTLKLLMTISVYDGKSENTLRDIGTRLKEHERLAAFEQVKTQYAETRLERHPHDLRFVFQPSGRIIYENAQFLRSNCFYFNDILGSTFEEGKKRVVDDQKTWFHSKKAITSEPSSIKCNVPFHTIVVEEERLDTYAAYHVVLDWVRCGQASFGPIVLSPVGSRIHSIEPPLQEIPFNELDAAPEGEPRPPATPTIASPEGVYRLCDRLNLSELRTVAFNNFKAEMKSSQTPDALFSTFSCDFQEVADFCIEYCATHWSEVDKSPQMEHIRTLIEQDELAIGAAEGARLLSRLFVRVMNKKTG